MIRLLEFAGILIYMELVYHLGCYGLQKCSPLFPLGVIFCVAALQALFVGCFGEKGEKWVSRIFLWIQALFFMTHMVYFHIFKQPLQLEAVFFTGGDALKNYWREALTGVRETIPFILLLILPIVLWEIWRRKRGQYSPMTLLQRLRLLFAAWTALIFSVCCIVIGNIQGKDFAREYLEYYDPETVSEKLGVTVMAQRDLFSQIEALVEPFFSEGKTARETEEQEPPTEAAESEPPMVSEPPEQEESAEVQDPSEGSESQEQPESSEVEEIPDTSPNMWELDLNRLAELSQGNKETRWLADYIAGLTPTNRNEYTGKFEGYNLIFLTAEGFSPYAVQEDLTPTLYKMVNSSFVFRNYYVPIWQTSTSDGEYVNCTGLIPDGQFSMRKSSANNMAYTLPEFFAAEGVHSRAYHNNRLSYYDRHLTHPNLGYDFKASLLGDLSEEEWGDKIFPMENPQAWPSSDYEMMQGTVGEYIGEDRFHVYYLTVSGHMNYSFVGNQMSKRNKEAVAALEMSESNKAYIACQLELEKAMTYLIEQLELAGKLENTVICLSADHYPYAMEEGQYEELAGKELSTEEELYRNSLILWNAAMEETVYVDKVCSSLDLLPTLLNLFGFEFDSRMYAGRDIFCEEEGLVIFKNKGFVTDTVIYNKKDKSTIWKKGLTEEEQQSYLEQIRQEVNERFKFSSYILRNDYYNVVEEALATIQN